MSTCQRLIAELTQEAAATRRVLKIVPDEKLEWRPHAKSMTLGELATHVAMIPFAIADLLSVAVRELPNAPRPVVKSTDELVPMLDRSLAHATEKLWEWGDQALEEPFRLTREGHTIFELPRGAAVRTVMLNHWYHHRGQLTVYLRLLDVPLPAIYGSSADEKPFA